MNKHFPSEKEREAEANVVINATGGEQIAERALCSRVIRPRWIDDISSATETLLCNFLFNPSSIVHVFLFLFTFVRVHVPGRDLNLCSLDRFTIVETLGLMIVCMN